jgi:AraC family transcriptional regulator of adaptative response / DNA-3-methyladenine glycosylase II
MVALAPISGVVTTGIYCRDGCPGRPKRRNVRDFSSPAAAEAAGFRACLRCRPYRLPPAGADGDAPAVVARALLLIGEGALDDDREEEVASRLNISARQLRRLFLQHVGATPSFVARSRRAHFARRLLDETDLTVTEIAFAAGFSSIRQMNRVVQETFRAAPTALRARRLRSDRLVADGGLPLRVPYHRPFSFADTLAFLGPRAIAGVESVGDGAYRRTIVTCGNPGAIELSDAGDGRHLIVVAHLPTYEALIDDVARVRRIVGANHSPTLWISRLMDDPVLAPLVVARPGLRPPGAWDPFEVAVRIIIGQGISVAGASTIAGRLAGTFGTPVPGLENLGLSLTFPAAERLADARPAELTAIGLTSSRADAIRTFARAYAAGDVTLDCSVDLDVLLQQLEALPGIGPWTANFIAMRAATQLDALPAEDLGLRRAMARLLGRTDNSLVDARELLERAEQWRPYRAVAAMHLWASLGGQ